jgi:hypothetical protein
VALIQTSEECARQSRSESAKSGRLGILDPDCVWENEAAMKDYRIKPPHLQAMAKLLEWCDEASVMHWTQETKDPPTGAQRKREWPSPAVSRK